MTALLLPLSIIGLIAASMTAVLAAGRRTMELGRRVAARAGHGLEGKPGR